MIFLSGYIQKIPAQAAEYRSRCLCLFVLFLFLCLLSCSYLPQGEAIPDLEAERVRSEFGDLVAADRGCRQCLDARVVISLKSAWFRGSIDGYLKIQSPDHLKYVALNPLGQTQAVLATIGDGFHFLSLAERKSYRGTIQEDNTSRENPISKYIPADFPFERSFCLFAGLIFASPPEIERVSRAQDEKGYWLKVGRKAEGRGLVLFDDEKGIVRQYIILDREGRESLKMEYEDHHAAAGCKLPGSITITSSATGADIRLRLTDWRRSSCSEREFHYNTPGNFQEVVFD